MLVAVLDAAGFTAVAKTWLGHAPCVGHGGV